MKWIKRAVVIIFTISVVVGALYIYQEKIHADRTGLKIICKKPFITVDIKAGREALLRGVQARDSQDQEVTVVVESIKKKENDAPNAFTVQYAAFDRFNHVALMSRTVRYKDYHPPRFTINKPLRFAADEKIQLLDYIQAIDCVDGDISASITVEGSEQLAKKPKGGMYHCTLKVTNRMGDTAVLPIWVEIYEKIEHSLRPEIILKEQIVYLPKGAEFQASDYLDYINQNGVIMINRNEDEEMADRGVKASEIGQVSTVNTEKAGNYSVVYEYGAGVEQKGSARLIVVVEDDNSN